MKQKELPAAKDSPMDAADPATPPRAAYPLLQKCSSESRVESLHKGLSRSSSQQSSAAPSIRSNSDSNAAPRVSRTGMQHCKLHRSSTSAPSTPEGWWKDAPDSDLWNDSYQMGAYLCSNGRFSKLYMCFASDTGTEYTVKVVRKSRWSLSSFRSRSRTTPTTNKPGTPVDARRKQQRDIETTLANSSSPDLFAAASTSSQFSESFPASALLESPASTDNPSTNEDHYDGDSISLDHTRKPKRQSHYLNHHHHNELQEYALLKSLQHHASILQVQDLVEDSRHFYCVTEFYNPPEQSLHVYCNGRPLSETEAAPLFYQILSCINFCHQRHIIHCNLKLDAFVVVERSVSGDNNSGGDGPPHQKQIKLTDFSNAVVLCDLTDDYRNAGNLRLMEPRGSIRYMAPEVVTLDKSYASKCDVWSCGIILYVMLSGLFPLDGRLFRDVQAQVLATLDDPLWLIKKFRSAIWSHDRVSDEAKHFIHRLLAPKEVERPTAEQALNHPWMQPHWTFGSISSPIHNNDTMAAGCSDTINRAYSSTKDSQQNLQRQDRTHHPQAFGYSNEHKISESNSLLSNSSLSQPQLLERIEELTYVDSAENLKQLLSPESSPKELFPAQCSDDGDKKQQANAPLTLPSKQKEAIDIFVASHDRIWQEWQEVDHTLRLASNNALDIQEPLTRQKVRQAYQWLFHTTLLDEDVDRVFSEFDCPNADSIAGMDFFVAVLNEKDLIFTPSLQEAFEVFDTDHRGLVAADGLVLALRRYAFLFAHEKQGKNGAVVESLVSQIETDAGYFENGYMTLQELVAVILETAIPQSKLTSTVGNDEQTQSPIMSPFTLYRESSSSLPASVVKVPASASWDSDLSATSSVASRRQSSLLHRLSFKFSAKHFIAQRPGLLSHYYELTDFVNEGGCGAVWFCKHKETGAERAVKLVRKALADPDYNKRIMEEFLILRELDHPNILRQYELFEDPNFFYIVLDAARGGDLCDELDDFGAFVEPAAYELMKQLLSCINYLHSCDIVHCDLKPENILLEANKELSQLKLIDFGFASNIKNAKNQRLTKRRGTLHYSAPEVFAGDYGKKVDLWSAGVICFLLLSDEFPFWDDNNDNIIAKIQRGNFSFSSPHWDSVSDMGKDFVAKLLEVDEDKRMSSEEALLHPWIRQATENMWSKLKQSEFDVTVAALTNFMQFSAKSKLKQAAYTLIASQILLKEEKQSIDGVFRRLDTACNGRLSRTEIRLAIRNFLGVDLSDDAVDRLFLRVDVASTGFIEYSEFLIAAMSEDAIMSSGKLKSAFDAFDYDKSGHISATNLKYALSGFLSGNAEEDDAAIAKIIEEVDTNGDGLIQYSEFENAMSSRDTLEDGSVIVEG